ncbi:MAG TPA: hypothetical protein VFO58_17760 [Vicinamibacterales bacterium]|nr:hypothetical protein [Vicinamibacterales bacterium]
MKVWIFTPGGEACGTCQGMQGIYEHQPGRPHPNCQCDISSFDRDGLHCHHEGEREIHNEGSTIRVVQHFTVDCCCDGDVDGDDHEVEIYIERTEDWERIAATVDAAIDGVEGDCDMADCPIV